MAQIATIVALKYGDGGTSQAVHIRIKRGGNVVYAEVETFSDKHWKRKDARRSSAHEF